MDAWMELGDRRPDFVYSTEEICNPSKPRRMHRFEASTKSTSHIITKRVNGPNLASVYQLQIYANEIVHYGA